MPRVALNAEQRKAYKLKDLYTWIKGRMSLKNITQADIGAALGVSQTAVSAKLLNLKKGKDALKHGELMIFFKELDATDDDIVKFSRI